MSGPTTLLERHTRVTPAGIRFWDEAAQAAVDQLLVELYPAGDPLRRAPMRANRVGTFVVPRLPGARDPEFDFGDGSAEFWASVTTRAYVAEVSDPRGDYQPFTMTLQLPARGLAVPSCALAASPPLGAVPVFPTVSRRVPAGMAVVRSELRAADGAASWAVMEVQVGNTTPVRGLADRQGRVAVIVPYPEPLPTPARPASPPFASGASLHGQQWPVRVAIFYEPVRPAPLAPDLCRALEQSLAFAWTDAQALRPLGDQVLRYGQELVIPSVLVTPATSPP